VIVAAFDQESITTTLSALRLSKGLVATATRRAIGKGASVFRGRIRDFVTGIGQGWEPLHPINRAIKNNPFYRFLAYGAAHKTKRSTGNRHRLGYQRESAPNVTFLGKLATVFRYSLSPAGEPVTANVGILREFVGEKAVAYFMQFQHGGKLSERFRMKPFTNPSMRKYWGALGFPLSKTEVLDQEPREVIVPAWERNKAEVSVVIRDKFEERLQEYLDEGGLR
jgi:hypothetical protein